MRWARIGLGIVSKSGGREEILGWSRRCSHIWSKKEVESVGTAVAGSWTRVVFCIKICWRMTLCKMAWVRQLEQEPDGHGSPCEIRLGYLPWLISCGLFLLNPWAWGDARTIPTTTERNYHLLAILKHQHPNKEYNIDNNNYDNNVETTVSATHTQVRSISSPHSNRNGIQYHQLSKILLFKQFITPQSF